MWRTRAVRSLLIQEVASLRLRGGDEDAGAAEEREAQEEALSRARRRAGLVVALDWLAITVLFWFHQGPHTFLSLGPSEETVFTLAILAIAVHSGLRLGQLLTYRAVARVLEDLGERDPEGARD